MAPEFPKSPILIVGAGRSGTTLVRSLLSAHSRIAVTPETHFLKFAAAEEGSEAIAPADFEAFWEKLICSPRFRDLGVAPDHCRTLLREWNDVSFRSIFAALLAAYMEQQRKPRIGEKTPGHARHLARLLDWYPDARVLFLLRDPRSIIASQLKTPWVEREVAPAGLRNGVLVRSRVYQVARYARDWVELYQQIMPEAASDPRVTVVSYEALVQQPERELPRICDFLEEPYEPSMLTGRSVRTVPVPAKKNVEDEAWADWRRRHHAQTLRPVSADGLEKWRDELSSREIALIEGCCARTMHALGYPMTTGGLARGSGRLIHRTVLTGHAAERRGRGAVRRALDRTARANKSAAGDRPPEH